MQISQERTEESLTLLKSSIGKAPGKESYAKIINKKSFLANASTRK